MLMAIISILLSIFCWVTETIVNLILFIPILTIDYLRKR